MTNKSTGKNRGFTLVETLAAVLLLSVAIAGPLTIASKSLIAALVAKDQVISFFLAQDAVEYVRFVRDTNKLQGNGWLDGLASCTSSDGNTECTVDSAAAAVTSCSGTCPLLLYDTSTKLFGYSSGTNSIFRRIVSITTPVGSNSDEALLQVTVEWSDTAGITRSISVQENLFDWQ